MAFGLVLMVIESIITWYFMSNLLEFIEGVKPLWLKYRCLKFLISIPVSFSMNLLISSLMTYFTGDGLIAGFANLMASVVVGILFPVYFKKKYDLDGMAAQIEANKKRPKSKLKPKEA